MSIPHTRILALCDAYLRLRTNYHEAHDQVARLVKSVRSGEISYPTFIQQISDNFLFANESAEDMGLVMEEKGRYVATSGRLNSEARRQRNIRARRAEDEYRGKTAGYNTEVERAQEGGKGEKEKEYIYPTPRTDPFGEGKEPGESLPHPVSPANSTLPAKTLENIEKYREKRKNEPWDVNFEGEKLPGQGDEYRKSGLV